MAERETDIILRYYKNPIHAGMPDSFDRQARQINSLCGDEVHLFLKKNELGLGQVYHQTKGCMICKVSASLLCASTDGLSMSDADSLSKTLIKLLEESQQIPQQLLNSFPDLRALHDFINYPARKKCALLPWQALQKLCMEND